MIHEIIISMKEMPRQHVQREFLRQHQQNALEITKAAIHVDRFRLSPSRVVLEFHDTKINIHRDSRGEFHIASVVPARHFDKRHQQIFLEVAKDAINELLEDVEKARHELKNDNG